MTDEGLCPQCGQSLPKSEEWKRRKFRWGMVLAVVTFVPVCVLGFINAYQSISAARTTGLGAVAGGFSEILVLFGLMTLFTIPIIGIRLLVLGYPAHNTPRAVLSILGTLWFGYVLVLMVLGFLLYESAIRSHMQ